MIAVVRTVGALPGAAIPMTPAPAWCIAAYDAALARRAAALESRRANANGRGGNGSLDLRAVAAARDATAGLRVTVLDVGQADAIVVQTPRGHALLVDAGGRLERNAQSERFGRGGSGRAHRRAVSFAARHASDRRADPLASARRPCRRRRAGPTPSARRGVRRRRSTLRRPRLSRRGGDGARGRRTDRLPARRSAVADRTTASRCILSARRSPSFRIHATTSTKTRSRSSCATARSACSSPATRVPRRSSAFSPRAPTCAAACSKSVITARDIARRRPSLRPLRRATRSSRSGGIICSAIRRPSTIAALDRAGSAVYRTDENGAVTIESDGEGTSVEPLLR